MLRRATQTWVRGCLAAPCLAAALCFGMVGCGGGGADNSGSTETSTPAAGDNSAATTPAGETGTETDAGTTTE